MFVIAFLIQFYIYLRYNFGILYLRSSKQTPPNLQPPLSVVICARNEYSNLERNLPFILEQNYPNFQVVVVDDCSEDDTDDLLKRLKAKYPQLYTTRILPDAMFKHGKKLALTIGIKAAVHDHLVLTDADCTPNSKDWLMKMQQGFSDTTKIVLGYSPVRKTKGWLNHYLRYENLFTAIQYLGAAKANKTYMGVGRNIAYHKELFFKQKGFAKHIFLLSGDDDLFINQVATKNNTAIEISTESLVSTDAPTSWITYKTQRRRHITTGKYYKSGDKWRLGIELLSRFFFYTSFVVLLVMSEFRFYMLGAFVLRLIIQWLCINLSARKLQQSMFPVTFLLYDILSPAINGLFSLSNMMNPKGIRWK